jgi:acetolactate synthase I/II/III large subunit
LADDEKWIIAPTARGTDLRQRQETLSALEATFAAKTGSVIHIKLDPDAITPTTMLSAICAKAL